MRHEITQTNTAMRGTLIATVDLEGTADGFGTVFSSLRFPLVPGTSGACTWIGQGHPEGTLPVSGAGDGTWEKVGDQQRWKVVVPVMDLSNGSRVRCEGEIDLPTRTFTGQMFDAS